MYCDISPMVTVLWLGYPHLSEQRMSQFGETWVRATEWPDFYLANYTIEPLPNNIIFCQSRFTILTITKYDLKKLPNSLKISPKWWNFARSGHTECLSIGHTFLSFLLSTWALVIISVINSRLRIAAAANRSQPKRFLHFCNLRSNFKAETF